MFCIFYIFRILFPDLPENGGPLQIRSEKYVDYDSDEENNGVISLNRPEHSEKYEMILQYSASYKHKAPSYQKPTEIVSF